MLIARINAKVSQFDLNDRDTAEKLHRIALMLENQTKINVRRQGLVDTGNLLNSIRSAVNIRDDEATIEYGSFGVRYAAVHEFGFVGNVSVRSHNRRTRSGQTTVRQHNRNVNIKARPYIRPSLIQQRRFILRILREV